MRKLQIILDSDNVIVEPIHKLLKAYNEEYGTNLYRNEILDWNLKTYQKEGTDIIKYFSSPGFFRDLPIIKNAKEYIRQIIRDGHEVIIATASPKEGILDKIDFFAEHFPEIPYENVLTITRKDLLRGDILLDDAPHNLIQTQCTHPVIFDDNWNRDIDKYPLLKDMKRVVSWEEFYKYVNEVAKSI